MSDISKAQLTQLQADLEALSDLEGPPVRELALLL